MENVLSVKDFVIDIPQTLKELKNKKANNYSEHKYEIVLENNTDFVLNRKTTTTDKNLVFLISQGIFYIKNNKNEQIETITEQKLRAFFQQIYYDKFTEFKNVAWWGNSSPERKLELMMEIIKNKNMQELYKHCVFAKIYDCKYWIEPFKKNKKLFQYCYDKLNTQNKGNLRYLLGLSAEISDKFDFNNAKYFIDKLVEGNIKIGLYYNEYGENQYKTFVTLIDKYNLNFNRVTEYVIHDLYSQGIENFDDDVLRCYSDYLNMQVSLHGKVKEKYPKHLKTEHDIITLKFNTYQKYKKDLLIFNVADKYKDLGYKTKQYSIVLPTTSIDIVEEGINQSHCVGSYVDKVAKNESLILFMRNTDDLEKSLITIEVLGDKVTQVKGFANRLPEDEEVKFLKAWAKEKELIYNPDITKLN